ncbi:MAG: DUF4389 domain-containing protein [Dehalococcoidia bacterium]|nr:DUF4389 domain-containing protein [Dehalococcoidia bacterium]
MATLVEYPVRVEAEYPQASSRVLAALGILFFLKALLLLPHLVVLYFLEIMQVVVAWFAFLVVLFTGRYPGGGDFVVGISRWQTRTTLWLYGVVDRYPLFGTSWSDGHTKHA